MKSHLESIEAAFRDIPRPECTKRVARALDDEWCPSLERVKELQRLDHETRWQEIPNEELIAFSDTLCWMSPEAVRFYYPAFLRYTLHHWYAPHDEVHREVMETPGNDSRMLSEFSAAESRLIHAILSELAATPEGEVYNFIPTLLAFKAHFD